MSTLSGSHAEQNLTEYEIRPYSYDAYSKAKVLAVKERIIGRFGMQTERNISNLGSLELVMNIFALPHAEFERLFATEGEMEGELNLLFVKYCNQLLQKIKPHLRERKNAPRTTMSAGLTYEDVYEGISLFLAFVKGNDAISEVIQKGKHRFELGYALTYFRENRQDFLDFILNSTSPSLISND